MNNAKYKYLMQLLVLLFQQYYQMRIIPLGVWHELFLNKPIIVIECSFSGSL